MSETAKVRVKKNLKVIKSLISELQSYVDRYESIEDVHYGHVGDLADVRGHLYEALGREGNPDPK